MILIESVEVAILLCVITMLGWGSWANTQKLAGKDRWPFQLYYWDYAIGVFLFGLIAMLTLGSLGSSGMGALENLRQAEFPAMGGAVLSGGLFNLSNILLVVAIDAAGMAVAFPVGVGLALVIGTVQSYILAPKGNPALLFVGVALVLVGIMLSAIAHGRLPKEPGKGGWRGIVCAVVAGCLMGFFYPQLVRSISPDFNTTPVQQGFLTPYTALAFFGLGLLLSNFAVNTVFMRVGKLTYGDYFAGSPRLHSLGLAGGFVWMLALTANIVASGVAGPAISYALGQGATLVAAVWGVFVWREFRDAPGNTNTLVALMFTGFTSGLVLIGLATL